jgi:hypothetical protein
MEPSEVPSQSSSKKTEREGLPAGYRMRADAHYVDQLSTRRGDPDAPRGGTKRALDPADVESTTADRRETDRREGDRRDGDRREADRREKDAREVRDRRTDRVLAQLLQDVEAMAASAALLSPQPAGLAQRAHVAAVRAHAFRAAWLLRAHTVIDGSHRPQLRARPLGRVLDQVREGLAAECGLTGLQLDFHASDWNVQVAVDDVALAAAVAAGIFALAAFLPDASGATIKVNAAAQAGELRTLEISQDEATVAPNVSALFFDQQWGDRPGGAIAAVAAACVKAVAALHAGDAVFMAGARRGGTIRINFPRQTN